MISSFNSGFSLTKENEVFNEYLINNDFTMSSFSFGCIKALNDCLNTNKRVDLLQLFSPVFFQAQSKKFLRLQLMYYKKDSSSYCDNFLQNISYPSSFSMKKYFKKGTYEELEELLNYEWLEEDLNKILEKGTKIEVYLGGKDKIIDSLKACEFFKKYASVYFIKDAGHILKV